MPKNVSIENWKKRLSQIKNDLCLITEGCGEEMHEPDEQGVSARVIGTKLDNAFGPSISRQAAAVFDLGLAGVDLIEADGQLIVLEVNSSPGFQTIEECHGVDVAKAILEHGARLAR